MLMQSHSQANAAVLQLLCCKCLTVCFGAHLHAISECRLAEDSAAGKLCPLPWTSTYSCGDFVQFPAISGIVLADMCLFIGYNEAP